MSVICLDLVVWIFLIKGYKETSVPTPKPQGKGNEEWVEFQNKETSINIMVRGSQVLLLFILSIVCCILLARHQEQAEIRQVARQKMDLLNNLPKKTWLQVKEQSLQERSNVLECPICLSEFLDESYVVQLKCH